MNEPNWADKCQAFGAIASVVIAIIVVIQNLRIKTLTDVVRVLSESHSLQLELTLAQRLPVLRILRRDLFNAGGNDYNIWYHNIGQPFHNLQGKIVTQNVQIRNGYWEWQEMIDSGNAPGSLMIVKFLNNQGQETHEHIANTNFICNLYWETATGEPYKQILSCTNRADLLLSNPILVNDPLERQGSLPLSN